MTTWAVPYCFTFETALFCSCHYLCQSGRKHNVTKWYIKKPDFPETLPKMASTIFYSEIMFFKLAKMFLTPKHFKTGQIGSRNMPKNSMLKVGRFQHGHEKILQ